MTMTQDEKIERLREAVSLLLPVVKEFCIETFAVEDIANGDVISEISDLLNWPEPEKQDLSDLEAGKRWSNEIVKPNKLCKRTVERCVEVVESFDAGLWSVIGAQVEELNKLLEDAE